VKQFKQVVMFMEHILVMVRHKFRQVDEQFKLV
jgi:hypothetical protein